MALDAQLQPDRVSMQLLRLACGVTFQPVYTFSDRIRVLADEFRADLLTSDGAPGWFARGFQVEVADPETVRVRNLEQPHWHATVSSTGVYFQMDTPSEETVDSLLLVQADLTTKAIGHLNVQALNSLGIKFTAAAHQHADAPIISRVQQLLGLDPEATLLRDGAMPATDVLVRLGYRFAVGSAALEVSAERDDAAYVVGLDCYSWDTLALDRQYLEFMRGAYRHYHDDVAAYLAPLSRGVS
jgi:hypothetical protein